MIAGSNLIVEWKYWKQQIKNTLKIRTATGRWNKIKFEIITTALFKRLIDESKVKRKSYFVFLRLLVGDKNKFCRNKCKSLCEKTHFAKEKQQLKDIWVRP